MTLYFRFHTANFALELPNSDNDEPTQSDEMKPQKCKFSSCLDSK